MHVRRKDFETFGAAYLAGRTDFFGLYGLVGIAPRAKPYSCWPYFAQVATKPSTTAKSSFRTDVEATHVYLHPKGSVNFEDDSYPFEAQSHRGGIRKCLDAVPKSTRARKEAMSFGQ